VKLPVSYYDYFFYYLFDGNVRNPDIKAQLVFNCCYLNMENQTDSKTNRAAMFPLLFAPLRRTTVPCLTT
jgi:hypothetical protein